MNFVLYEDGGTPVLQIFIIQSFVIHGPLRKCQVQEMWAGEGILLPYTLSLLSIDWA
jgi:hypothetical protein